MFDLLKEEKTSYLTFQFLYILHLNKNRKKLLENLYRSRIKTDQRKFVDFLRPKPFRQYQSTFLVIFNLSKYFAMEISHSLIKITD